MRIRIDGSPVHVLQRRHQPQQGWRLIDRFSEDIDIALYRDFFLNELHRSCAACETNNQIMNLRKVSRDYVTTVLKTELEERLKANGLTGTSIEAVTTRQTSEGEKPIDHDSDPTVLNVHYKSILSPADKYIRPVVKIEISCLSLKEPYQIQLEKPRAFEDAYHADTANIEGVYYYAYTLGRVTIRDSLTQSMFDKGIELLQPDPDAMYRFYSAYGDWLVKKERFDEARDKYIAARSYDPERLTVLPSLGYCYERLKDWKNAAIYYKEFMDRAENKESDVYNFTKEALDYVNGKLFMEEE